MIQNFPPPGTTDCHVHVIGPKAVFPLASKRSYTPVDATVAELSAMLRRVGSQRTVIVQPSIYEYDNSCLVDALGVLGNAARGVAVVADDCPGSELDRLHRSGVRGLRANLISSGKASLDEARRALRATASMCARNGWHIQLFAEPALIVSLAGDIADRDVKSVLDHFAMIRAGDDHGELAAIRSLQEKGIVFIKLSAPYRVADMLDDPAVTRLARTFAEIPESVLWGSDWPHTPPHNSAPVPGSDEVPYRDIPTRKLLDAVAAWFPDPDIQRRILVDNPTALYGW